MKNGSGEMMGGRSETKPFNLEINSYTCETTKIYSERQMQAAEGSQ